MAALLLYFFPDVACSRRSDSIARRGRAAVSGERVKLYTGKTGRGGESENTGKREDTGARSDYQVSDR